MGAHAPADVVTPTSHFAQTPRKTDYLKHCHTAYESTLESGQQRVSSPCVSKYRVTHFLVGQPCESRASIGTPPVPPALAHTPPHHPKSKTRSHPASLAALYTRGGMARGARRSAEWQPNFLGGVGVGWMFLGRFPLWAITNTERDPVRSRPKLGWARKCAQFSEPDSRLELG